MSSALSIEGIAGEEINHFTKRLVNAQRKLGQIVTGKFNDVVLEADEESSPTGLVKRFHQVLEERREAYRNSPEYIRDQ
ncbi:MAG: hypothetical protein NUV85_03785 [Candidatus Berkelbacteria bacterium]|nr:hypothetical protein [Candidatus Berkelbacteria bacterium]